MSKIAKILAVVMVFIMVLPVNALTENKYFIKQDNTVNGTVHERVAVQVYNSNIRVILRKLVNGGDFNINDKVNEKSGFSGYIFNSDNNVQQLVTRYANNDGNSDDKTKLTAPAIDDIKAGSENIKISKPADGVDKIVITETDKNGQTPEGVNPVEIIKDKESGKWKIGDTKLKEDNDGKLIIPVKNKENPHNDKLKLDEYNTVKVKVTGDPDTTEPGVATKVVGEAADTTPPATPKVVDPVEDDTVIKVEVPKENDAKTITVEITKPGEEPTTETIVVEKQDDGTWKVGNTPVTEKDGKLEIPVDNNVKTGDTVKVETKDDSNNKSDPYEKTAVDREKLPEPTIDAIKTGDKTVKGTAKDASTVDVYQKEGDGWKLLKKDVGVSPDGSYTYNADTAFKNGDQVRVVAKKPGMEDNFAVATVGVDTTKLEATDKEADEVIKKATDDENWHPDGEKPKPVDKELKDKSDAAKKVLKDVKESEENKPDQNAIDKAEKELRKAIENKNAYDKAIEDLKKAKEKLENKLKEAEKEGKTGNTIDDAKKKKDDADKIVNGKGKGEDNYKTEKEIVEIIKSIKESTEELKKSPILVTYSTHNPRDKEIIFTTNPSNCKIEIMLIRNGQVIETYNTQSSTNGSVKFELYKATNKELKNNGLMRKDRISILVTDPSNKYLDVTFTINVR